MNYYDYRDYFRDLIDNTDLIYTELQLQHTDVNARLDSMNTTMEKGFGLLAALIVLAAALQVIFR